jgi:hypothetical protein
MLVVSTGLMLRSFKALLDTHPGFEHNNVLTMQVALPALRYDTPERRADFYRQLDERLRALPGVRAVGLVNILPMDWNDFTTRMTDEARRAAPEGDQPVIRLRTVSPDYFTALQIPLQRGRVFDSRDRLDAEPVAIVSDRLARQVWPNDEALGQRVQLLGDTTWRTVVGVVADTRHNPNMGDALQPTLHLPLHQRPGGRASVLVHTAGDPNALSAGAQRVVASLDEGLAAGDVRSLDRVLFNAMA